MVACTFMKANAMTTPRSNHAFAALRNETSRDQAILRDQFAFLCTVWGPPEASQQDRFGALCFRRRGTSSMIHRFIAWQNGAVTDPDLARFNRHD